MADYGSALLWAIYLSDNYGTDFLSQFVQAGIIGIEGINAALAHFGFEDTFDDAFHGCSVRIRDCRRNGTGCDLGVADAGAKWV